VAYARGSQVLEGQVSIPDVQALALGFQGDKLLAVTGQQVELLAANSAATNVAHLAEAATAADFSPDGQRLAYLGASGLHVLDLKTGRDTVVGTASALGAWSKDGRYAYPAPDGVYLTEGSGQGTRLLPLRGAAPVSWS